MVEFFEWFASATGLEVNVAAQLFISILGTVITVLATLAAWAAVSVANSSIHENKEARLEQYRPVLGFSLNANKFTLRWSDENPYQTYPWEPMGREEKQGGPELIVENVGNGAALELGAQITFSPDGDPEIYTDDEMLEVFTKNGFVIERDKNKLYFVNKNGAYGVDHVDTSFISSIATRSCKAGKEISINLEPYLGTTLRKFALACLRASKDNNHLSLRYNMMICFTFKSIVGEVQKIPILLQLRGGSVQSFGEEYCFGYPSKKWEKLEITLNMNVYPLKKIKRFLFTNRNSLSPKYFSEYEMGNWNEHLNF